MRGTPSSDLASAQLETLLGAPLTACRFRAPGVRSTATWHFDDGCVFAVTTVDRSALDRLRYGAHHGAVLVGWTAGIATFTTGDATIEVELCDVELVDDPTPR